jgi:hypothetical protein
MKKINITKIIDNYILQIKSELEERWNLWDKDLNQSHIYEVVGGILSRQTSLAIQFAKNPNIWNGEIAPILLRSMADNHINLAWILMNPNQNSEEFITHGLGQLKLELEHRKRKMEEDGISVKDNPFIQDEENFINSQRYSFLTAVNFGSWSGSSTRKMAEEANLLDFYNYVYQPFSNCVHSTWGHISKYNNIPSKNQFHKFLRHPQILDFYPDFFFLELAAKYLAKSFRLFDRSFPMNIGEPKSFLTLQTELQKVVEENNEA